MEDTFGEAAPEQREDRGPRIPPAKLADLNDTAPYISLFYKQDRNSALQCVEHKFSRDVAMVFCDRIRHDLMDNSSCKSFTVTGINLKGLKYVLNWIKASVEEKKTAEFEKFDQDDPDIFIKYVNAIIAANYLGIPARDFANSMTKVMLGVARKVQMTWDQVEYFLYDPALNNCSDEVRGIATASIFYAWWNAKLTDEDTPEDMMYLSWLRDQDKDLDDALHDWCVHNQEDVEKRKAEKRAKRAEEAAGVDGGAGEGWGDNAAATGAEASAGAGWDTGDSGAAAATGESSWDQPTNEESTGWEDGTPAEARNLSNATNTFNANGAAAIDSADRTWDSSDHGAVTREGTPGVYDSASTVSSIHDGGGGGSDGKSRLPAFEDDRGAAAGGGDWADEVNQSAGW
ncbi:hypothetical protein LTR84_001087 [Exophiala bonariae]|uniref:Uncharacterized protein n=1 Tax=Exophiala bonariae TaxID=1690606 RepID=A0AAV9NSF1_9EURO|nr:hypothetical protein LTR84_001087 [Exophiala bonariae]